MFPFSQRFQFTSSVRLAVLLCLTVGFPDATPPVLADHLPQSDQQGMSAAGAPTGKMAHMSGHMYMTSLKPAQPGDQQKADAVVEAAKTAMAPYQDYRKALADGYVIFHPKIPQPQYHFTKHEYGQRGFDRNFDPLKPTSLLYKKTPDGGYDLVGAMYTDRVDATEDELNNAFR